MFVGDRNPTSTTVHHCFNPAFGHARTQPRKNAHRVPNQLILVEGSQFGQILVRLGLGTRLVQYSFLHFELLATL
ncbi:uncharacterized protein LOC110885115 isoform X2 [Helianthus annuus]|uniref:uncharacterized protein LOC110885115 isoform X2 n=1 Tax=Helianthus annuus TaxID=4232 RepID=UPI001652C588|nr:uncharacterized protein LOC110885115 isoform X2 [Helianthus annuus]